MRRPTTAQKFRRHEQALVSAALKYLDLEGLRCWRQNCGLAFRTNRDTGKQYAVRGAPPGTPDIIGYAPDGRFIGIECKALGEKIEPGGDQERWLAELRTSGGVAIEAWSIDDIRRGLSAAGVTLRTR